jgi:hypothetical protein
MPFTVEEYKAKWVEFNKMFTAKVGEPFA